MLKSFLAAVLLSASVERFFVSRMRDFLCTLDTVHCKIFPPKFFIQFSTYFSTQFLHIIFPHKFSTHFCHTIGQINFSTKLVHYIFHTIFQLTFLPNSPSNFSPHYSTHLFHNFFKPFFTHNFPTILTS